MRAIIDDYGEFLVLLLVALPIVGFFWWVFGQVSGLTS